MNNPILSIKDVSLSYESKTGDIEALQSISFDIYPGEFVCVLGPSGCGKSTLLKLIAGFEDTFDGEILLEGEPIKGIDWRRGVVFQKDNLFDWLSVKDNINYGLRMRKIDKDVIESETTTMLEKMGLTDFADKYVYELSGGMRQRVGIGRTLINKPEIILMDEPFSALDALTREQLQDFLRDLWFEKRMLIFFITHDIDEAMTLGTRLLLMSSRPGRIINDIKLDYTYQISKDKNSRRNLSKDYFELRRELYNSIKSSIVD